MIFFVVVVKQIFFHALEIKLTDIFPAEAASSTRPVGVQVSVSEVTLLIDPQAALVIIHHMLPTLTLMSLSETTSLYIYTQNNELNRFHSNTPTVPLNSPQMCDSHVDLVDLVLQLFIRGEVLQKLLLLVFAVSVSVVVVAAHVAARQLGLRVQIVGQSPGSMNAAA